MWAELLFHKLEKVEHHMQGLRESPKTSSPSTEMEASDKEEGFLPPYKVHIIHAP